MLEYDVAISYAGEQRVEAQAISDCIRRAGIKVFYDKYELATLWGKDLYEHLSEVYWKKARFCLMLVSAAYASKVWTTHERKNAQARALLQSAEYILPVRFDDTEIPGLPPTVGYLRFQDYGVEGICSILLEKLRAAASLDPLKEHQDTSTVYPQSGSPFEVNEVQLPLLTDEDVLLECFPQDYGWTLSLKNNRGITFTNVLVTLLNWGRYAEVLRLFQGQHIKETMIQGHIQARESLTSSRPIIQYDTLHRSLIVAGGILRSSESGIWKVELQVDADGYSSRLDVFCFYWQKGHPAVLTVDPTRSSKN